MHFLDKRVNVICEELKKLKVKQKFEIDNWKYKEGNFIRPEEAEADAAAWEDFDCQYMHWYGKDRHYWFKTAYHVCERGSHSGNRHEPPRCAADDSGEGR